ncbi:hypothetical protein ACFFGT_23830 [Mucilaginibacter angelicae]|uniref:Uncharacterized protein n=1 Tax=Mucilaginibacter angelicae TaxID=869718 RepID=A0ABV6LCU6_9SPHI
MWGSIFGRVFGPAGRGYRVFFGGFLLIIGLMFRPVCILILITLVVAASVHLGTGGGLEDAAHAIEDAIMFTGLIFIAPKNTV